VCRSARHARRAVHQELEFATRAKLAFGMSANLENAWSWRSARTVIPRFLALLLGLTACTFGCNSRRAPEVTPNSTASASGLATSRSSVASTGATPGNVNAPPAEDGPTLYKRYCALCHGADAQGYAADNAPSLTTVSFLESASDEYIASAIRVGRPGTAMAAYIKWRGGPLNDRDVRELVRFIRSKGPKWKNLPSSGIEGDVTRGQALYTAQCVTCHGTEQTRGNAVWLFNTELLRFATPEFLSHAIVHGRPPTPMLPYGDKLSATQIADLVTFLKSKAPLRPGELPRVDIDALKKLPVVVNPRGKPPTFTLRDARFVSVDQVKDALAKKNRMVLVDARSPADFIQAHIPGAIPNGYYDKAGLDRIKNDGTWVIAYCACPHHASGEVVDELRRRGFKHTAILDEGILEWQHRGYPIEGQSKTQPPAPPQAASVPLSSPMPKAPGVSSGVKPHSP
jgi:cytochrome c oxidase cbb3-type subunit III